MGPATYSSKDGALAGGGRSIDTGDAGDVSMTVVEANGDRWRVDITLLTPLTAYTATLTVCDEPTAFAFQTDTLGAELA